jgi:hypothetical protein
MHAGAGSPTGTNRVLAEGGRREAGGGKLHAARCLHAAYTIGVNGHTAGTTNIATAKMSTLSGAPTRGKSVNL